MNWINTDYKFGLPMRGIFIPGNLLSRLGYSYAFFNHPSQMKDLFNHFKDYFPSDAILVRVSMPPYQDGVHLFVVSNSFERLPEGEVIPIQHVNDLVEDSKKMPGD